MYMRTFSVNQNQYSTGCIQSNVAWKANLGCERKIKMPHWVEMLALPMHNRPGVEFTKLRTLISH